MMEFTTKSKLYIAPKKKNYFFLIILNVCIVIVSILSLMSIFGDGVKAGNVSPIIVGLFVVIRSRTWLKSEPYYEFCMAHVTLDRDICISFDANKDVVINTNSVISMEYSDKLECLRFVADYDVITKKEKFTQKETEFLFYIVEQENHDFFVALEQQTGKEIIFVDRNTKA